MNLKNRIILEDYRKQRDDFVKLGDVVHNMLKDIVDSMGITVPLSISFQHRILPFAKYPLHHFRLYPDFLP